MTQENRMDAAGLTQTCIHQEAFQIARLLESSEWTTERAPIGKEKISVADVRSSITLVNPIAMKPQYYELVDALLGMALQYLEDKYGNLDDGLVSAGEHCIDVLSRLGLLEDGKIVSQAFDSDWLKEYLGNI